MIFYPLHSVGRLRKRRTELANKQVRRCRDLWQTRQYEREQCEQSLADYRHWRQAEEHARFVKIKGTCLSLTDLEDVKVDISMMRARETELEAECKQAITRENEATDELEQARIDQAAAVRAEAKYTHHRDQWMQAYARDLERREEGELEEFSTSITQVRRSDQWF